MADELNHGISDDSSSNNESFSQESLRLIESYQTSNPDLLYSHSGSHGFAAPLILILGLPIIAILAAVYSYIVVYCPVVGYVNVLFTGGFLFAMGFVIKFLAKKGKCRSTGMMTLIGFGCGLFALYAAWVFFIKAIAGANDQEVSLLGLIINPIGIAKMVVLINNEGWWAPSGIVQWILSGIEAILIVGAATMTGASSIDREVFCEACHRWCEASDKMLLRPTQEMLGLGVENVSPEHFLSLDEVEATEYPRLDAEVLKCKGCESLQAIRFQLVYQELDNGELKEQTADLNRVLVQRG